MIAGRKKGRRARGVPADIHIPPKRCAGAPARHGSAAGGRAMMGAGLAYCVAGLCAFLASGTVRAADGFRPGLWAITTVMSGAMDLTSRGDYCLRDIGPAVNTTADLGVARGPHGPMTIRVQRRPGVTVATWGDRVRIGGAITIDHGQDRFTGHGRHLIYRGTWKRTQRIGETTMVIRAVERGHWLGGQCPKIVAPARVSSPMLAELNTQLAHLSAATSGVKAEIATANAALARENAQIARQQASLAQLSTPARLPAAAANPPATPGAAAAPARTSTHPVAAAAPKTRPLPELFRHPPNTPQGQADLWRAWAQLRKSPAVRQGASRGPVAIQIVFDPDEPFCHALWVKMQAVNPGPVVIRWVPVALVRPSTLGKAAAIVTAPDPSAALAYDERHFNVRLWEGGIRPLAHVAPTLRQTIIGNTRLIVRLTSLIPFMIYRENGRMHILAGAAKRTRLAALLRTLDPVRG